MNALPTRQTGRADVASHRPSGSVQKLLDVMMQGTPIPCGLVFSNGAEYRNGDEPPRFTIVFRQKRGELRAWMFGIMHNHFIDGVRAAGRRSDQTAPGDLPDAPVRATQTDQLEVRDLDRCLLALPAEQREVLLLIAVEDLSYQETARILSVPIGTVMSRLSRAREKLGALMQGREPARRLRPVPSPREMP